MALCECANLIPSWMVLQTGTAAADRIRLGCKAGEVAFADNKCRRTTSCAEHWETSLTSAEPATENWSGAIGKLMNSEDGSSAAPATAPPTEIIVMNATDSKLFMMLLGLQYSHHCIRAPGDLHDKLEWVQGKQISFLVQREARK
jgi:hypothetical protein